MTDAFKFLQRFVPRSVVVGVVTLVFLLGLSFLLAHRSDNPIILGRYSVALFALVIAFILIYVVFLYVYFRGWSRFSQAYTLVAHTVFTTILLFVFANLAVLVATYVSEQIRGSEADMPQESSNIIYEAYGESLVSKAYPGVPDADRDQLLHETWSRPVEFEPFSQFRERPYNGNWVNVDPNGFRSSKNQGPWPPDPRCVNVFLFGGSTTFGYGVADHDTIASYLQEFLRTRGATDVNVYNFGRGFYYSSQERVLFERLLVAGFAPTVAVFVDGINEFSFYPDTPMFSSALERGLRGWDQLFDKAGTPPLFQASQFALSQLPLMHAVSLVRRRISRQPEFDTSPRAPDIYDDKSSITYFVRRYARNRWLLEVVSAAESVRALFVWQPAPVYKYDVSYHLFPLYDPVDSRVGQYIGSAYHAMEEEVRRNALSYGPNFLWLADIQERAKEALYIDAWHYSAKFSSDVAAAIVGVLLERNFITKRSVQ